MRVLPSRVAVTVPNPAIVGCMATSMGTGDHLPLNVRAFCASVSMLVRCVLNEQDMRGDHGRVIRLLPARRAAALHQIVVLRFE